LNDKELWRSLVSDPVVAPATISDMDFAAWLEGRLSEDAASRIEAAVAADPDLRRAALELADILGKPLPEPPPRMAVRAHTLVGFEVERRGVKGSGWLGGLLSMGAAFGMPKAAMATAALLVAVSGFAMGGGLGESYAQEKYVVASIQTSDSANELTAFFGTDGI
jgi:hypothetical protein